MSSINSYADIVDDLMGLREAIQSYPELQPSLGEESQTLAQKLEEIQALKARQQALTALRQEVTQQLKAAIAEAKDVAIHVRSVVRGKIGHRSERLVHFRVNPTRKRPRKLKVQPKDEETPGTGQGTPASASAKPVA